MDGSPPGSPIPGILQARTMEWDAISFSNAWKWKVKAKSLSRIRLLATSWTTAYQAPPSMGFSRQEYWSGVPLPSLRTNPREYQIVRTHRREPTWLQDPASPSNTLFRMPHLNNKQNKNTNPTISRQDYHLTQPCQSEEKQTNKNSAKISPYRKLTETTGPILEGHKLKGRQNSTFFKEKIQLSLKPGKETSPQI